MHNAQCCRYVGLCANDFRDNIQAGNVNEGQADNYTEPILSEGMLAYGMHIHRYQGNDPALVGIAVEPVAAGALVDGDAANAYFNPMQKPPDLSVRYSSRGTIEYAQNGAVFHEADAPADTATKFRPCVFFDRIAYIGVDDTKGVDDPNEVELNQMQVGQIRWVYNDDFDATAAAVIAARFDGVDARNTAIEATAAANLKTLAEVDEAEETARKAEVSDEKKRTFACL